MAIHCRTSGGLAQILRRPSKLWGGHPSAAKSPSLRMVSLDARRHIRDALDGRVQAKLKVSQPGDAAEREADRTAEAVMRIPSQAGAGDRVTDVEGAQGVSLARDGMPKRGRGMSDSDRAFFEPRFGCDLGQVRVHDDAGAAAQADQLHARAFTVGNDIAFARGEYAPGSDAGRHLMAHELAHVVQQGRVPTPTTQVFRKPKARVNWVLRQPPDIRQSGPTCWAAAMASWLLVKGIVQTGFDADFLIRHYRGTECTDDRDTLVGNSNDDIEAVFAEWRILLDLDATIAAADFSVETAKRLIEKHGHFLLIRHADIHHALVVYGVEVSPDNPADSSLMVMDPLQGYRLEPLWSIDYDISIGVGVERSAGQAPCRSRKR